MSVGRVFLPAWALEHVAHQLIHWGVSLRACYLATRLGSHPGRASRPRWEGGGLEQRDVKDSFLAVWFGNIDDVCGLSLICVLCSKASGWQVMTPSTV